MDHQHGNALRVSDRISDITQHIHHCTCPDMERSSGWRRQHSRVWRSDNESVCVFGMDWHLSGYRYGPDRSHTADNGNDSQCWDNTSRRNVLARVSIGWNGSLRPVRAASQHPRTGEQARIEFGSGYYWHPDDLCSSYRHGNSGSTTGYSVYPHWRRSLRNPDGNVNIYEHADENSDGNFDKYAG